MLPIHQIVRHVQQQRSGSANTINEMLSQEDMPDPKPNGFYIQYNEQAWNGENIEYVTHTVNIPFDNKIYQSLLLICCDHCRKRNPAMSLDNYLKCWTQDMAEKLMEAGVTFERLITDVKSQLSSETSSSTTNASDTMSSSSSRPIETASPTLLF